MAVISNFVASTDEEALHSAIRNNDVNALADLPPMEVPTELLISLLSHPLASFRDWGWYCGGSQVVDTAIALIWQDHSIPVTCDFAARLGTQAVYESCFAHPNGGSDAEFLTRIAAAIGYPNLKWAAVTSVELLMLAMNNPELDTRYIQRVERWAASSPETEPEAQLIRERLALRQLVVQ